MKLNRARIYLLRELIAANPKSKDVPAYKYLIAAHYYRHMQFPESRPGLDRRQWRFPSRQRQTPPP